MTNTLLFICRTNILVRLLTINTKNCLTPKNLKMCDPILVTLLKMGPHYSQSSCENATPSTSTSPLASYKQVSPLGINYERKECIPALSKEWGASSSCFFPSNLKGRLGLIFALSQVWCLIPMAAGN